jgi:hypothetical protein
MKMRIAELIVCLVGIILPVSAGEPEGTPEEYNVECPASRLCPDLEKYYQACKKTNGPDMCGAFVATFRKLTGKYDCQRSFDHTPTADYTVPAIWVCREVLHLENKRAVYEEYIALLLELSSNDARCFFASSDFRGILDGEYAESLYGKSLDAEKEIDELNCLPPEETDNPTPEPGHSQQKEN